MSTQAIPSLSENLTPFTAEAAEERREQRSGGGTLQAASQRDNPVFDGPWKVAIAAEPEMLPPGVLPGPQPHESRTLPWRMGDVARLKDDSPEGMMRYIATHTEGWWQDMAERALRDTEKAERMAEQLGLRPGQCWTVVVDAEARERMLAAEEAKRVREEAERARVEAEREAFAQRQLELLEKAGRAPRCEYVFTDGRGCRAPQVRGERWCHGHAKMMSYRPEKLEVLPLEDEESVTVTLYRTVTSLLSGAISEKVAGLVLWSVAIKAPGLVGSRKPNTFETQRKRSKRRETEKDLPRINADARGFRKQSALSNQHSAHDTVSREWSAAEHDEPQKTEEPQRTQRSREGIANIAQNCQRIQIEEPGFADGSRETAAEQAPHARQKKSAEDASRDEGSVRGDTGEIARNGQNCQRIQIGDPGTPPQETKCGFLGGPGVTNDKCFKSGVAVGEGGSTSGDRVIGGSGDR